jgi:hypothetical protein
VPELKLIYPYLTPGYTPFAQELLIGKNTQQTNNLLIRIIKGLIFSYKQGDIEFDIPQ